MGLEQAAIERLVYVADLGQSMLAKLTPTGTDPKC